MELVLLQLLKLWLTEPPPDGCFMKVSSVRAFAARGAGHILRMNLSKHTLQILDVDI